MTVRIPIDRIPSLCGTTPGLRQHVQAVDSDMSAPVSRATMPLSVAAPPYAAPDEPTSQSGSARETGASERRTR